MIKIQNNANGCQANSRQSALPESRTRKRKRKNELISVNGDVNKVAESTAISSSSSERSCYFDEPFNDCMGTRLTAGFFAGVPCIDLAKRLLGQILVRNLPSGEVLKGRIVEVECYLGENDEASHSYKGKQTERNSAMFMTPGTAYVYNIYGMYCCFNISSEGHGAAVLIRSLEPLRGLATMRKYREANLKTEGKRIKDKDLANGPSKLCQALAIDKNTFNKEYLVTSQSLWLEASEHVNELKIVKSKRIGIGYAGTWAEKLLRFYVLGNNYVSVRDKTAETILNKNSS